MVSTSGPLDGHRAAARQPAPSPTRRPRSRRMLPPTRRGRGCVAP